MSVQTALDTPAVELHNAENGYVASTTSLLGAAGEHYVMAELLRRGFIAALAPQGVPNMDIVVADTAGRQMCAVQVKTRLDKGGDGGWYMGLKHEKLVSDKLFYCFVNFSLSSDGVNKVYVIPSAIVAEAVRKSHAAWLAAPGKVHKDSNVRRLLPNYEALFRPQPNPYPQGWMDQYLGAWGLLG